MCVVLQELETPRKQLNEKLNANKLKRQRDCEDWPCRVSPGSTQRISMPLQRRGVHWPQDNTGHHNSDRPSASTSTWQARGRREPGIQACLLKTQGHLRNFPKRKPNNKVDKEILKRHTDQWPRATGESEEKKEGLQGHEALECSSGKKADGTSKPSVSLTPRKPPSHSINRLKC